MRPATNRGEGEALYWLAPIYLVEKIPELPVEYVLLLFRLYFHAWRMDDEWARLPVAQLAAEAGLSLEKTTAALVSLSEQGVVAQQGNLIGLTPEAGEEVIRFPPLPEA